jgi:hypothetical protein
MHNYADQMVDFSMCPVGYGWLLHPAETRTAKPFSRRAYDHGVVIVMCPGCKARHLLADRLGWFGQSSSIEDILAERGESEYQQYHMMHIGVVECLCNHSIECSLMSHELAVMCVKCHGI